MPDIDLDLVRCFVTVVESSGFTQASKRLHLTQSAITLRSTGWRTCSGNGCSSRRCRRWN